MTVENATINRLDTIFTKSNTDPISNEYELVNNTPSSKEYQTLINRFRRKNYTDSNETEYDSNLNRIDLVEANVNTEPNKVSLINETLKYDIDDEINTTELDFTELEKNSMEKLKVDETTRTKLFNDFFTTVNKNVEFKQPTIETTVFVEAEYDSFDVNGTDYSYENETDGLNNRSSIKRRFSNESLATPTSSRVPSFRRALQTPRPDFIEGKF